MLTIIRGEEKNKHATPKMLDAIAQALSGITGGGSQLKPDETPTYLIYG